MITYAEVAGSAGVSGRCRRKLPLDRHELRRPDWVAYCLRHVSAADAGGNFNWPRVSAEDVSVSNRPSFASRWQLNRVTNLGS